ncbi:MAG: twin-arginine translocation signal domain-containing protein [Ruminococcaceae bacterium]|nr:twin-arginine translocation signal domain-containing protein [Oscillospiraceae bacterium]
MERTKSSRFSMPSAKIKAVPAISIITRTIIIVIFKPVRLRRGFLGEAGAAGAAAALGASGDAYQSEGVLWSYQLFLFSSINRGLLEITF